MGITVDKLLGQALLHDHTDDNNDLYIRKTNDSTTDMGYEQGSSADGIGTDYITDKRISHSLIGSNDRTENGAIRANVGEDPDTLEIYLRDAWQTIIYDLTTEENDFRHTPLDEQIQIWSGNSISVGLDGQPIVQEYTTNMGAYGGFRILSGGDF